MRPTSAAIAAFALFAIPLSSAVIPRPSPEYTIQLSNGKTVKLSQYRGKVVALEFILTSCSECQRTAQIMDKLQKELGSKGFQALGVALNSNAPVSEFVRALKLQYPVGTGSRDAAVDYLQHPIMTTMMMPQLVLIGRNGQIQAQFPGNHHLMKKDPEGNIRAMVLKLLSGNLAAPKSIPSKKRIS